MRIHSCFRLCGIVLTGNSKTTDLDTRIPKPSPRSVEQVAPPAKVPPSTSASSLLSPDLLSPDNTTLSSSSQTRPRAPSGPRTPSSSSIPIRPRSRSSTLTSLDEDYSSSDDSVLSWWSDDEDDSDASIDSSKEAERRRREQERQKILSSAGLKLRREPPGIPPPSRSTKPAEESDAGPSRPGLTRKNTMGRRRRPAPAAPRKRRAAPAVPAVSSSTDTDTVVTPGDSESERSPEIASPEPETDPEAATLDAYARYEQFLASANNPKTRPTSLPSAHDSSTSIPGVAPQMTGNATPTPLSPTSTHLSVHSSTGGLPSSSSGGRFSTFLSKMMATPEPRKSTPNISGPITRVDSRPATPNPDAPGVTGGGADIGKTWSSLVDEGVLKSMSDRERKRQEAIFEFISTESTYNRDLQLIVEVSHDRCGYRQDVVIDFGTGLLRLAAQEAG